MRVESERAALVQTKKAGPQARFDAYGGWPRAPKVATASVSIPIWDWR